jgi:nucleoside-diphosphate-sugar epimerase
VAALVKEELELLTGQHVKLDILNIQDFRNYKVSCERATVELGFRPQYSVKDMVADVMAHRAEYGDFEADNFYNIRVFKQLAATARV